MPSLANILQIVSAVLLLISLVRYGSTSYNSPLREERLHTLLLMALITAGAFGSSARDRFPAGSLPFWMATAGLAVICGLTVIMVWKLFGAYKEGPSNTPTRSNTVVIRPPEPEDHDGDKSK